MSAWRRRVFLGALAAVACAAACTLNPQPLPPEDLSAAGDSTDAGEVSTAEGGRSADAPAAPPQDAGLADHADAEAGAPDASDDAADASDAS